MGRPRKYVYEFKGDFVAYGDDLLSLNCYEKVIPRGKLDLRKWPLGRPKVGPGSGRVGGQFATSHWRFHTPYVGKCSPQECGICAVKLECPGGITSYLKKDTPKVTLNALQLYRLFYNEQPHGTEHCRSGRQDSGTEYGTFDFFFEWDFGTGCRIANIFMNKSQELRWKEEIEEENSCAQKLRNHIDEIERRRPGFTARWARITELRHAKKAQEDIEYEQKKAAERECSSSSEDVVI